MSDFEREIEHELHRVLDTSLTGSIPAWRAPGQGSLGRRLLGGAGAALGVKVLTGIVAVAAAATVAGAATETVITGSVSPLVWGQQVKLQVEACKDKLSAGQHGIGDCVSDFTTRHGDTTDDGSQSPDAAAARNAGDKKPSIPGASSKNPGHSDAPNVPRHTSTASPQDSSYDREPTDRPITNWTPKPTPRQ